MNNCNEIWKDIKDYEGLYQVSNLGRVKRILFRNGRTEFIRERCMKLSNDKDGYKKTLLNSIGRKNEYRVHRLVAEAFIPNPLNKLQVNHINGIKNDNRVENLEWVTPSENVLHAHRTGLSKSPNKGKFGKDNHSSIAVKQYDLEGNFIKEWSSMAEAGRKLKIFGGDIGRCCRLNKKYKTVGGFVWRYRNEDI